VIRARITKSIQEEKEMAEKEYIERSEAKRIILENEWKNPVVPNVVNMILGRVPAADVVEVRHGHWIKRGNEKKCSVCGFIYYSNNDDWNGCPNCLAKMDGWKTE
jgi:rubrerythrin